MPFGFTVFGEVTVTGNMVQFTTTNTRLAQRFAEICGGSVTAPVGMVMLKCYGALKEKSRKQRAEMANVISTTLLDMIGATVESSRGGCIL
eukprot:1968601-Pyramimonas_sp.AAC.1